MANQGEVDQTEGLQGSCLFSEKGCHVQCTLQTNIDWVQIVFCSSFFEDALQHTVVKWAKFKLAKFLLHYITFNLVEFVHSWDRDLAYFSLVWFCFLKIVQQGIADHTERLVAVCSTWKDATSGGVCLSHQNPNNAIILFFLLELGLGFRQWVFA